jgi:hypothetical protein
MEANSQKQDSEPIPALRTGSRSSKPFLCAGVIFTVWSATAQDALRLSLAGDRAAMSIKNSVRSGRYNIRLDPLEFGVGVSLGVGYNDNISLVPKNPEGDFIISPQLNIQGYWPITEKNELFFSVGAGYSKYLDHPENDRFNLSPGSSFSYYVYVGDFRFQFHDEFSYSTDPTGLGSVSAQSGQSGFQNTPGLGGFQNPGIGGVSGQSEYGGFQNIVGVTVDWDLNDLILTVGYNHHNFVSTVPASDNQTSSSEFILSRASFQFNPTLMAGPEVTAGITRHENDVRGDNRYASVGAFGNWIASKYLSVTARAGYTYYTFSGGSEQTPSKGSLYLGLGANHTINQFITHSLNAGREIQTGLYAVNSDAVEIYYVRYQAGFNVIKNLSLTLNPFYEHGKDSPSSTGEAYDRFGISVGVAYPVIKRVSSGFNYQYVWKDSNRPGSNYSQNSVWLNISYAF